MRYEVFSCRAGVAVCAVITFLHHYGESHNIFLLAYVPNWWWAARVREAGGAWFARRGAMPVCGVRAKSAKLSSFVINAEMIARSEKVANAFVGSALTGRRAATLAGDWADPRSGPPSGSVSETCFDVRANGLSPISAAGMQRARSRPAWRVRHSVAGHNQTLWFHRF